jgi:ribulokinase
MNDHPQYSPPYFLGIDAGTEAVKAGLFDRAGRRIAIGSRAYKTAFPRPGWAEQDPDEWWDSLVGAVRDCLGIARVDAHEIAGISADATTSTLVPMGADGRPLRHALLWMDVRSARQAEAIFATGHAALRCCLAGVNAEWMLPKVLWLKQNEPDTYAAMQYLLEYTDWIAYRLTGRYTLNINTTAQRWFYHTPSGGWPIDFYGQVGLPGVEKKFPPDVMRIGEVVGPLTAEAAAVLGLPTGIPVAAGGGDAFIGILGQGVAKPGDLGVIMGSSNVLSALADDEFHIPGVFGGFPEALIPGLCLVEAGQVSTGSILAWFRRNFGHGAEIDAAARGISVYRLLDEEAAVVPPGSKGLIVLDYFQGNRTPHTDPYARGAIWGLSLQSGRAEVFRALMEGVAYGMADILATFDANDFFIERIIASGGATRSPVFMQIYVDVTGMPMTTTRETEASLLGSAIVAAVGAGAYPDLPAATAAMVTTDQEYRPDPDRHAAYQFYVDKYKETYRQLRPLMRDMVVHGG